MEPASMNKCQKCNASRCQDDDCEFCDRWFISEDKIICPNCGRNEGTHDSYGELK